jgi:tripartite-type tricarboxylate transporter receptor subunit TctC
VTPSNTAPFARRRQFLQATAAVALSPTALSLRAQSNDARTLNLVVGYPPGGSTDLTARVLGPELGKRLGLTTVIDNVGGAGGTLGAAKVSAAKPDGLTLLLGTNNEMAIHKLINRQARIDGVSDFTPIGLVASQPMVLVASQAAGVQSVDAFIKRAKAAPGQFNYGSSGVGTALHLAGEMIKQKAGLFVVHIPYRGVAPLTTDLVGGQLEYGVFVLSSGLPHIKSGKVHALGLTSLQRSAIAPDIAPLGDHPLLKGLDISSWFGVWGPPQMPPALVDKTRSALQEALRSPDVIKKLQDAGATMAAPGVDLGSYQVREREKYAAIVKFANIQE